MIKDYYRIMKEKPIVPPELIEEIGLKEPVSIKKPATLLHDGKQFSIKIPSGIIEEIGWKSGEKVEVEIESDGLKIRKVED